MVLKKIGMVRMATELRHFDMELTGTEKFQAELEKAERNGRDLGEAILFLSETALKLKDPRNTLLSYRIEKEWSEFFNGAKKTTQEIHSFLADVAVRLYHPKSELLTPEDRYLWNYYFGDKEAVLLQITKRPV